MISWWEIIGVVADERQDAIAQEAPPIMYWPGMVKTFFGGPSFAQRRLTYVIRSSRAGAAGFVDEVRQAVRAVDRNLPLARVRTVEQIAAASMAQTSFALVMLAIAAGVSLLLGIVGIYGVVSYIAAQQTREIGVRLALGADGPGRRPPVRHLDSRGSMSPSPTGPTVARQPPGGRFRLTLAGGGACALCCRTSGTSAERSRSRRGSSPSRC